MIEESAKSLLFDVDKASKLAGLSYMLYGGTCLGAIRDGKFIDVDLDVDFTCLHEDFIEKYNELERLLIEDNFTVELVDHRHDREWPRIPYGFKLRKYDTNADFFSMLKMGNKRYVPSHRGQFMLVHKAKHIEQTKLVTFYGAQFNVPKDAHSFLTEKYGNWVIPHKEFNNVCSSSCRKEIRNGNDFWWV